AWLRRRSAKSRRPCVSSSARCRPWTALSSDSSCAVTSADGASGRVARSRAILTAAIATIATIGMSGVRSMAPLIRRVSFRTGFVELTAWLSSLLRGLAAPCLRDDRPELAGGHGGQTHQDGGKPVVVRLGEELLRVQGQQHVLIREACDPDRDDFRLRHARLLGRDALHPHPDEALELAFVANREGKVIRRLFRLGQRQRNAADVSLSGHRNHLGYPPTGEPARPQGPVLRGTPQQP